MNFLLGTKNYNQKGVVHTLDEICRTITGSGGSGGYHDGNQPKIIRYERKDNVMRVRIRKLTPLETWRLMGAKDEDFNKVKAIGVSDSQLYRQAGNGLITNCVQFMMEHLYKSIYNCNYDPTDKKMENLGYGTSRT